MGGTGKATVCLLQCDKERGADLSGARESLPGMAERRAWARSRGCVGASAL